MRNGRKKFLLIDWDLEAPGLEHFFSKWVEVAQVQSKEGLIEVLAEAEQNAMQPNPIDLGWRRRISTITAEAEGFRLDILTAGKRDDEYFRKVRRLDVKNFYDDQNGGYLIERLRSEWKEDYDFILVDSRTGITDIGGICTIQIPDILALVFTATDQSLKGILHVVDCASKRRQDLPFDRPIVPCIPIPSRFDTTAEHEISRFWLDKFSQMLEPVYQDWLPKEVDRRQFAEITKVPHVPYYSFGEKLPVIESGVNDPAGLGYAYETLAALIALELEHAKRLVFERGEYIRLAGKQSKNDKSDNKSPLVETLVSIGFLPSTRTKLHQPLKDNDANSIVKLAQKYTEDVYFISGESIDAYFRDVDTAIAFGLEAQKESLVNPISSADGSWDIRIGVHCENKRNIGLFRQMGPLFLQARMALKEAARQQLLVTAAVSERVNCALTNFDKKESSYIEVEDGEGKNTELVLYELIGFIEIILNEVEMASLKLKEGESRAGGGFQAFLARMYDDVDKKTGRLKLTYPDLGRIPRYAFDYHGGGWQQRLKSVFERSLGPTLGRKTADVAL